MDHVHNITRFHIDEQDVVIITNPAHPISRRRQAILPRVVDPVAVRKEQVVQIDADAEPLIAIGIAIGVVVARGLIIAAILVAIAAPVVTTIIAPAA